MGYVVLVAWIVQAVVGVTLLVSWARHARGRNAGLVLTHTVAMIGFLIPWTVFLATGAPVWAWAGWVVLLVFIGFGDATMVRRARAVRGGSSRGLRDYGSAVVVVATGGLGPRVAFHALFAPVVFFTALGVAIGATVAAG